MQDIHNVKFDKVFYSYPRLAQKTPWRAPEGCYYTGLILCIAQKDKEVYVGVAKCIQSDQFNKKLGKKISLGRAEKTYNTIHRILADIPIRGRYMKCITGYVEATSYTILKQQNWLFK